MAARERGEVLHALAAIERIATRLDRLDDALKAAEQAVDTCRTLTATLEGELYSALVDVHPPTCPKCSGPMRAQRQRANGTWFFGCLAYPRCKGSLDPLEWRREAHGKLTALVDGEPPAVDGPPSTE